jgi:hypothetical protein
MASTALSARSTDRFRFGSVFFAAVCDGPVRKDGLGGDRARRRCPLRTQDLSQ